MVETSDDGVPILPRINTHRYTEAIPISLLPEKVASRRIRKYEVAFMCISQCKCLARVCYLNTLFSGR